LRLIVVSLCAALTVAAWGQTSTIKKKPSAAKTTSAKTTAKAPPKTIAAAAKHPATSKSKKAPVVARRPQQPSQERYKEIQQALAGKGYFNNEPDGNWGPASVDALKHFQHDQKLLEDGKIGSLSLIALGLGPKREPVTEAEQKTP
jgi:peptidoglycan hydrolase-like protein with peptidoglycan-binding domain